jgi:nickel-dependent lactate racemase
MQSIRLKTRAFDRDSVTEFDLPNGYEIERVDQEGLGHPPMSPEDIRQALSNPIGTPTIGELAKGKNGKVVVLVDDLSRATPTDKIISFIMEELNNAGIPDNRIFILGMTAAHYAMDLRSFADKVGWEMVQRFDCVNHNFFFNHAHLGKTSFSTPVEVNYEFSKADLRIAISGLQGHGNCGGASGGGKAILPGISSYRTVLHNHRSVFRPETSGEWWWHIKGNDARTDIQETARMAGLDVSCNVTFNDNRDVIGLHIGDLDDAWREGVKHCYKMLSAHPPNKSADIVVCNAYPHDGYAFNGAEETLKEGGTVVAIGDWVQGRTLHYMVETVPLKGTVDYWQRLQGYPYRRWPVKKAGHIMTYSPKVAKSHVLMYHPNVEWETDWKQILSKLQKIHGDSARVVVYTGSLGFNPDKWPLII